MSDMSMPDTAEITPSPVVLSFSLHDATGATGIGADIEAIRSQGCHAATVATCLSVQDSQLVSSLIPIDGDIIVQSARAVLEDMPIAAIKIGLPGSEEGVQAIYDILVDYAQIPVVLDPMLIGSNGMGLAEDDVIDALRDLIIPLTDIITLNTQEAGLLIPEADSPAAMMNGLMDKGCDHVLLSGRRGVDNTVVNKLYHNYRVLEEFEWPRLNQEYSGAGCTLSASLAALLAQGLDWMSACREAQNYCWQSLKYATRYGMGQYQPDRLYWMHEDDE